MDAGRFSSLAKVGSRMISGRRLMPIRMGMQVISHLFRLDKKRRAWVARAAKSNKGQAIPRAELPGGTRLAGVRGRRLYSAGFRESPQSQCSIYGGAVDAEACCDVLDRGGAILKQLSRMSNLFGRELRLATTFPFRDYGPCGRPARCCCRGRRSEGTRGRKSAAHLILRRSDRVSQRTGPGRVRSSCEPRSADGR
jgi:hypothetical protein